jgi:hypothetical protein
VGDIGSEMHVLTKRLVHLAKAAEAQRQLLKQLTGTLSGVREVPL